MSQQSATTTDYTTEPLKVAVDLCVLSRFSRVQLFVTLWTVAVQAPLSMGFSRQEYWSGLLCSPPGDLPDPGIKAHDSMSPALAGGFFTTCTTWEALIRSQILSVLLPQFWNRFQIRPHRLSLDP